METPEGESRTPRAGTTSALLANATVWHYHNIVPSFALFLLFLLFLLFFYFFRLFFCPRRTALEESYFSIRLRERSYILIGSRVVPRASRGPPSSARPRLRCGEREFLTELIVDRYETKPSDYGETTAASYDYSQTRLFRRLLILISALLLAACLWPIRSILWRDRSWNFLSTPTFTVER